MSFWKYVRGLFPLLFAIASGHASAQYTVQLDPVSPSTGQAVQVSMTGAFPYNVGTSPVVTVSGASVQVVLNAVCQSGFLCPPDYTQTVTFTLPGVPRGAYVVQVFLNSGSAAAMATFPLNVAPESIPTLSVTAMLALAMMMLAAVFAFQRRGNVARVTARGGVEP